MLSVLTMETIPQFGQPLDGYKERPSAYAVVWNGEGEILVVDVNGRYHLPGGGIECKYSFLNRQKNSLRHILPVIMSSREAMVARGGTER